MYVSHKLTHDSDSSSAKLQKTSDNAKQKRRKLPCHLHKENEGEKTTSLFTSNFI